MGRRNAPHRNTKVSETEASVYIQNRVNSSWELLLKSFGTLLVGTIKNLSTLYPTTHYDGFNFRRSTKAESYLFPRLPEVLLPFRIIQLENVKAVMIIDEPMTTGISTGIPFLYDLSHTPPLKGTYTDGYNYSPNAMLIEHHLQSFRFNNALHGTSKQAISDPRKDKLPSLDVITELIQKGILLIHTSWTCDSQQRFTHIVLWKEVLKSFIRVMAINKEDVPILLFGEAGRGLYFDSSHPKMFQFPDIWDVSRDVLDISTLSNPFDLINRELQALGKDVISF